MSHLVVLQVFVDVPNQLLLVVVQDFYIAVQLFEFLAYLLVGIIAIVEVLEFAVQGYELLA